MNEQIDNGIAFAQAAGLHVNVGNRMLRADPDWRQIDQIEPNARYEGEDQLDEIRGLNILPPADNAFGQTLDELGESDKPTIDAYGDLEEGQMVEPPPEDGIIVPTEQNEIPDCPIWQVIQTEEREVNIKLFDFRLIRPDFTVVVYGKRRTGKTYFVRCLMKAMRRYFPEVYVFTETKIDVEYEACVPDKFIIDKFNPDILESILDRQKQRVEAMRKRGKNDENIYVLVVLDDCITGKHLEMHEVIRRAFFNGRHYYMSIIINSQDTKALGPNLRANIDFAATFPVRSERDKEAIRTNFADFLKNDRELDQLGEVVSGIKYNMLFFDQSRPYMLPEDTVYAGVMPPEDEIFPFVMGTRNFWKGSEKQLIKYGNEHLLDDPDWDVVKETYAFKMTGPMPSHQKEKDE